MRLGRWPEGQLYLYCCHPERRRLGLPPESKDPYSWQRCHPERELYFLYTVIPSEDFPNQDCHPDRGL